MAEILHFEILRKHGQTNTHTNKHTNKQTDMGITIPRPPPMGGEVIMCGYNMSYSGHTVNKFSICDAWLVYMKFNVYICGTDILHN